MYLKKEATSEYNLLQARDRWCREMHVCRLAGGRHAGSGTHATWARRNDHAVLVSVRNEVVTAPDSVVVIIVEKKFETSNLAK